MQLRILQEQISTKYDRLSEPPKLPEPVDLGGIQTQINQIGGQLQALEQDLQTRLEGENLSTVVSQLSQLQAKTGTLQDRVETIPALESRIEATEQGILATESWQNQILEQLDVSEGFEKMSQSLTQLQTDMNQFRAGQETESRWTEQIIELVQTIRPYRYRLVWGKTQSREVLMEALGRAKDHLILVTPWLSVNAIDAEVIRRLRLFLGQTTGIVEIGWGYWPDIEGPKTPHKIPPTGFVKRAEAKGKTWQYTAFQALSPLVQSYPERLKLKLLFTHEKYLVCDEQFAMVGSHNFLTSSDDNPGREVGVQTDDPHLIQELRTEFLKATDWGRD